MTSSMSDVRRSLLIALSAMFAATTAMSADTQVTGEVTVQAERPSARVVGRSSSGIPIVLSSVQYRVNYSDLELSIPSNAQVLKTRVRDAARAAWLVSLANEARRAGDRRMQRPSRGSRVERSPSPAPRYGRRRAG